MIDLVLGALLAAGGIPPHYRCGAAAMIVEDPLPPRGDRFVETIDEYLDADSDPVAYVYHSGDVAFVQVTARLPPGPRAKLGDLEARSIADGARLYPYRAGALNGFRHFLCAYRGAANAAD